MNHQAKLLKSIEEKIRFPLADANTQSVEFYDVTAKHIVREVLQYVNDDIAFEQSMKNAVNDAIAGLEA